MGALLSYSIISGTVMLAMYLAYRLFLTRDNQHGFNRGVLLMIYAVSLAAVPAATFFESIGRETAQAVAVGGFEVVGAGATPVSTPMWGTILIWIFMAGMAAVAARTAATWIRLISVIRSGRKVEREGYTLVVTDDERFAPFSWLRYVVISRKDFDNACAAITTHELKHVASRHWIDLLVAQGVCIINWFNPAAWLMRDELMLVHEYQADMAVIDSGLDPQEYQMLLIKKAVGARFPSLANSLNHSKLKKRITMMYKEKSGAGRKFKALALVPMLALALGATGTPAVRAAVSAISSCGVSSGKGSENPPQDKVSVKVFKVTDFNNYGNETTITIKGEGLGDNLTVSGGTFTTDGKTYRAKSLQCNMTNGVAEIIAKFPFTSVYDKPSMTLTVDGEEVPFDLEKFFDNAQSVIAGGNAATQAASSVPVVINGDLSSLPEGMQLYINGEKVSETDLKSLSNDKIASVSVDRQNNVISIALK